MNVEKLIEKAGGVKAVADALKVSTQAIYKWQRDGYIPLRKIRAIANLTGIPENKLGIMIP
ncbi:MAG: Cro/CI family transcriptional regulator [Verrucomicrobia bacterium]|nr:Cro/CI family transcriptional regulator [Verrucomicrobiota bacterium]